MKAWMIWVPILVFLAFCRIGIRIVYRNNKLLLWLTVSKFTKQLIGEKKNKREKVPKNKKSTPNPQKAENKKTESHKAIESKKHDGASTKPWISAILEYWQEIIALIGRVLTTPTLDILNINIAVGAADAEACAMTYGRICSIIGGCLPVIENTFRIKKRSIDVSCFFDREKIDVDAETSITVRVYEVFVLLFALLGLGIKILVKAQKIKKAV